MQAPEQLEVISTTGEIVFYDLDSLKGITNIGRDPENDIVIDSPSVAPFHAMLDHRQEPYQLVILSEEGETTLGGETLVPHVSTPLQPWDTVEVGGYSIVLIPGAQVVARQAVLRQLPFSTRRDRQEGIDIAEYPPAFLVDTQPAEAIEAPLGLTAIKPPPRPAGLPARPSDIDDNVVLTEISEREWAIEAGQTTSFDVTITNGGPIVATFEAHVIGLDPTWVTITPPSVNLNEGDRATITITITPPREPASFAGPHHLAAEVTSVQHPGRSSQRGATLTIIPYYEFAVGELSPKQQKISWRQRSGAAALPIANKGNSDALFRIDAQDDERGCDFEFRLPGEIASLARQADVHVAPEEIFVVPIDITPRSRRLVGLRGRRYSYTVTANLPEAGLPPRAVMGQLTTRPLIGPGLILLTLLFLVILVVLIFNPSIHTFEADPKIVEAGTPVALYWEASNFTNLRIGGIGEVAPRSGRITVVPLDSTVYRLEAGNWLSALIPRLGATSEVPVAVTPVLPVIRVFDALPPQIIRGDSHILRWEVVNADRLVLKANNFPVPLLSDEHMGQQDFTPDDTTTYVLEAYNHHTGENNPVSVSEIVRVIVPTPTPLPTPIIEFFSAEPNKIFLGEEVTLNWSVAGLLDPSNPQININVIGPVGPAGPAVYEPDREGTVPIELRALNGEAEARRLLNVLVDPAPTPTPEPIPPKIETFEINPKTVVLGNPTPIELIWTVSGDVTDIQISAPGIQPVSNLPKDGTLTVTTDEATVFILKAFGVSEDLFASETRTLEPVEPSPTPAPTDTPVPTATPVPIPEIRDFMAEAVNESDEDKVNKVSSDPLEYAVVAGTRIEVSWIVINAAEITLIINNEPPSSGWAPEDRIRRTITNLDESYVLEARNSGQPPDVVSRRLFVNAIQETPPAPSNVTGEVMSTITPTIKIDWDYGGDENDIIGFRLYRANFPPGTSFDRVANEDDLNPGDREWIDTEDLTEVCGKVYYVVGVYVDFNANRRETEASTNSWSSSPCPTPTPEPN